MDVLSFIASLEGGGGGVSTLKSLPVAGTATQGKMVQVLTSNGNVADLPLKAWGYDTANYTTTSAGNWQGQWFPTTDPNVFVYAFRLAGSGNYFQVRVLRVNSDGTFTYGNSGNAVTIISPSSSYGMYEDWKRLGTTNSYMWSGEASTGGFGAQVVVFSVDTTTLTVTVGTPLQIAASTNVYGYKTEIIPLDNTSAVVFYSDYSPGGTKCLIVNVSGTTCTAGTTLNLTVGPVSTYQPDICGVALNPTTVLIRAGNNAYILSRVTNSLGVSAPAAIPVYGGSQSDFTYIEQVATDKVLVMWNGGAYNNTQSYAAIITNSGGTPVIGTVTNYFSGWYTQWYDLYNTNNVHKVKQDANRRVQFFSYQGGVSPYAGYSYYALFNINLTNNTVNYEVLTHMYSSTENNASGIDFTFPLMGVTGDEWMVGISTNSSFFGAKQNLRVRLNSNFTFSFVSSDTVAFMNNSTGHSNGGSGNRNPIVTGNGWAVGVFYDQWSDGTSTFDRYGFRRFWTGEKGYGVGVLQPSGEYVAFGLSVGHTGLIPGAKYYYDSTGFLTTLNVTGNTYIGRALSPTELYIDALVFTN